VLGALSGRGPQSNGIHGAFSFTPGNLGFGHTGKTSSGKDAHMAYLMLRHIKLRHQRRVVSSNITVKLVFSSRDIYITCFKRVELYVCVEFHHISDDQSLETVFRVWRGRESGRYRLGRAVVWRVSKVELSAVSLTA